MRIWLPACRATHRNVPAAGLPRRTRLGGLQPVIHGIADDVGQRIADHLDHLAIQLDILALDGEGDGLAQLLTQIAHHAGQRRRRDARCAACGFA